MEKLPSCRVKNCSQAATVHLKKTKKCYCGEHFFKKYELAEGERLISADLVGSKIRGIEKMLKIFAIFIKDENDQEPDERTLKFQEEFYHKLQELKDAMNQALQQESFYEFGALMAKTRNIQASMDCEQIFSEFACKFLWSLMEGQCNQGLRILTGSCGQGSEQQDKLLEELKQKDFTIETLEEENKKLHLKIEELKSNLNSQDQRSYFFQEITAHCKNISGENIQFSPETRLKLELSNPKHMEFLTSLEHRMPELARLSLDDIPVDSEEVKTFLATRFPFEVSVLDFNHSSPLSSSLSLYMEELSAVSQRVRNTLFIKNFEVSQPQLITLLSSYKSISFFGFIFCRLSLSSVPDFGGRLEGSTLKRLYLSYCGGSAYGDWATNESHFGNLFEGLSKEQDFKNNLKEIWMSDYGMERKTVEETLAKHGFGHVGINLH
ncbi:unnamed protein product [Moneuplotes crassus]|uniref:Uncharacterized protein n=1 Tax=Euplotes crassus TaxID=5936 RepID=A0AAD1Y860_EUPCR|nr:unnamed protein product [Moneuplotes crassus]